MQLPTRATVGTCSKTVSEVRGRRTTRRPRQRSRARASRALVASTRPRPVRPVARVRNLESQLVLETRRQSALVSSPLPLGAFHCPLKQVLVRIECASSNFVFTCVAANQGDGFFGEGGANNQAAQAIDQSRFGGDINQGQAGEREMIQTSLEAVTSLQIKPDPFPVSFWPSFDNPFFRQAIAESKKGRPLCSRQFCLISSSIALCSC
jgi:hypothetical protein